jgi:hypothetical protein
MELRYGFRRLSAALLSAAIVVVPLAVFLFPVTVVKDLSAGGRPASGITCFAGTEFISFRLLWQLDGLSADETGLVIEASIVLVLSVGLWASIPLLSRRRGNGLVPGSWYPVPGPTARPSS